MRRLGVMLVALVALAVMAVPAAGQVPQTEFTSKASISPKKAGTKKNPQGIKITGSFAFETITQGVEEPIITGGDILIAKGGVYNGGKYKKCSATTMRRSQSTDDCPRESIMGSGKGVAFADTVDAAPDVELVNGGAKMIWAFTTLYRPALVREPVPVRIQKLRGGKWAYKASFRVPKVLQVVAGVPVTLRSFRYSIGGKPYAKKYIATTSCPKSKKYAYEATAHYLYNTGQVGQDTYKGSVACR